MAHGRRISRVKLIPPTPEIEEKYYTKFDSKVLYSKPHTFEQLSSQNLFGHDQKLQLEIGCGTGEFLLGMAKLYPEKIFVGVEVSTRAVYYAAHLASEAEVNNLRFLHADFKLLYPLLPDHAVEKMFLRFPDPNHSEKHKKRRIFDTGFLDMLERVFTRNASLYVITDNRSLFEEMRSLAGHDKRYVFNILADSPKNHPPSRFQQAWKRIGRPLFQFELKSRP